MGHTSLWIGGKLHHCPSEKQPEKADYSSVACFDMNADMGDKTDFLRPGYLSSCCSMHAFFLHYSLSSLHLQEHSK